MPIMEGYALLGSQHRGVRLVSLKSVLLSSCSLNVMDAEAGPWRRDTCKDPMCRKWGPHLQKRAFA